MNENFKESKVHITSDDPIVPRLLFGLSTISAENLADFQAFWPNLKSERRETIMKNLVEINEYSFEVDFEPIFILGLNDADPEVQVSAIEGLWESGSPALIPLLIHLLKAGQTVPVRATAATALGQFVYLGEIEEIEETSYEVTEQALLATIRQGDEDLEVVRRAIEAISFSSHEGIPQIIENAYYHDDENMQVSAVFAMGRSGDSEQWGKLVLTELENRETKIRFEAVRAAGELQLKDAVPPLIDLLEKEADSQIQQSVVWSLGQIGGPEAREAIEILLDGDDEILQEVAEEALDELTLWSDDLEEFFAYTISEDDEDDMDVLDLNGR